MFAPLKIILNVFLFNIFTLIHIPVKESRKFINFGFWKVTIHPDSLIPIRFPTPCLNILRSID